MTNAEYCWVTVFAASLVRGHGIEGAERDADIAMEIYKRKFSDGEQDFHPRYTS